MPTKFDKHIGKRLNQNETRKKWDSAYEAAKKTQTRSAAMATADKKVPAMVTIRKERAKKRNTIK